MAQDSSSDLALVLLDLEERMDEKISQQFVALSDRLDAVLPLIPAERLLAASNEAGNQAVAIVASPLVSQTPAETLQGDSRSVATQGVAVTALTVAVLAAEALADASSAIATQEALATHPAHESVSDRQESFYPGEYTGNEGIAVAAGLACNAASALREQLEREGADDEKVQQLHRVHRHLQKLVTALPGAQAHDSDSAGWVVYVCFHAWVVKANRCTAQAYDCVRKIRKGCSPACQDLAKFAVLAVRETLILQICCSVGTMSDIGFECTLETAFGRRLGPELRSQLHLARSAIGRLGRDVTAFQRAAPKIFSSQLHPDELSALFIAYSGCTDSIGSASGTCRASQHAKRCSTTVGFVQGRVCYTIHLSDMTGKTKTVEYKFEDGQNDMKLENLKMEAKEFYGDNWLADNLVFLVSNVSVVHGGNQTKLYTDYDSLRKFCFVHSKEPGDSTLHVSVVLSNASACLPV